jgi:hypothetical protein
VQARTQPTLLQSVLPAKSTTSCCSRASFQSIFTMACCAKIAGASCKLVSSPHQSLLRRLCRRRLAVVRATFPDQSNVLCCLRCIDLVRQQYLIVEGPPKTAATSASARAATLSATTTSTATATASDMPATSTLALPSKKERRKAGKMSSKSAPPVEEQQLRQQQQTLARAPAAHAPPPPKPMRKNKQMLPGNDNNETAALPAPAAPATSTPSNKSRTPAKGAAVQSQSPLPHAQQQQPPQQQSAQRASATQQQQQQQQQPQAHQQQGTRIQAADEADVSAEALQYCEAGMCENAGWYITKVRAQATNFSTVTSLQQCGCTSAVPMRRQARSPHAAQQRRRVHVARWRCVTPT